MNEPNSEKPFSLLYKRKPITLGVELVLVVLLLVFGVVLLGVNAWLEGVTHSLFVTVPLGVLGVLTVLLLTLLVFDIVLTLAAAVPFRAWVIILLLLILLVLIFGR